jgi:hypothetical protein
LKSFPAEPAIITTPFTLNKILKEYEVLALKKLFH